MKPSGPVARRGDYIIEARPHAECAEFVREHHYARGCARTSVMAHGMVRARDGVLVGAALWMPPTKVAAQSVAGEGWRGVLALSRLCVLDGEPQNAASILLGASLRLVRRDSRWTHALTYADTRHGHSGTIYRATNWTYCGTRAGASAWRDGSGRQVAIKATHSRTVAEMLALGYERMAPSVKHKFVQQLREGGR